jgi:hypothetical protein
MKVFIRASELDSGEPVVIASYDDAVDISPHAHGDGMILVTVPGNVLTYETTLAGSFLLRGLPKLARDWRERSSELTIAGEAKRRIEEVLPASEQMATLYDIVDFFLKHGTDISSWPTDAKDRKAEIEQMWNYVREVKERARALKSTPANPTSDKVWPTRIAKKK